MEERKQYCENLLKEYLDLIEKTKIETYDLGPGGKIQHPISVINLEDLEKKIKVREKLHKCLDKLSDENLEELFRDDILMRDALKILLERRIKKLIAK